MLMSKAIIFTATLPYEAYKSYKREVDYGMIDIMMRLVMKIGVSNQCALC